MIYYTITYDTILYYIILYYIVYYLFVLLLLCWGARLPHLASYSCSFLGAGRKIIMWTLGGQCSGPPQYKLIYPCLTLPRSESLLESL